MRKMLVAAVGVLGMLIAGAVSVPAATAGPDWLAVVSHSAKSVNAHTAVLTMRTQDEIPEEANAFIRANLGAGFAWADLSTGKVFAMTIHPTLGVDSIQNPRGWHAHAVTLTGGATAPNDFCIKSIDSAPLVRFSIDGHTMRVRVKPSDLPEPADHLTAAAGFTIQRDTNCASGLAVRLSTPGGD